MTSAETQAQRREELLKLAERTIPDNTVQLLDETQLPLFAVVSRGRDGEWVSLHESDQDALDYFAQDDSDYAPALIVNLDTGEQRRIVVEASYRIGDTVGDRA